MELNASLWGRSAGAVTRRSRWQRRWTWVRLLLAYTAAFLWFERPRFLSAVLAVAFSAILINLQVGLVLGIYAATSIAIDHTRADVWVGAPHVPSVDAGRGFPEMDLARVAGQPEVVQVEGLLLDYGYWVKPDGTRETCIVVGSRLAEGALGAVGELTPQQRALLAEPGAVVVDEADRSRLGIRMTGDTAEVVGHRVRVVGWVRGLKGLNAPYVFCSLETARELLHFPPGQTTYLLARCRRSADAPAVVRHLRRYADLSAFTSPEFSLRTRLYWLTQTPGGLVTLLMAGLALLVGAAITREALYAATLASLPEYALLRALGIRRRRIAAFVLGQSLGVGLAGVLLALPLVLVLGYGSALLVGIRLLLPWWLLAAVLAVTTLMTLLSGLATLRSLRLMDPVTLLH